MYLKTMMKSFLSFLLLSASTMVTVTSQCYFCVDGIILPDYVVDEVNGTTCNDVPDMCVLS
jgi:hypothetical protein